MVAANPEKVPQKSREKETNEFLSDEPPQDNNPSNNIICIDVITSQINQKSKIKVTVLLSIHLVILDAFNSNLTAK